MNLGSILDGLSRGPSVTHPVRFAVAGINTATAQKTRAFADAVLVHVDEEERPNVALAAAAHLAKKFPGQFIPDKERDAEEAVRFFAVALRDKADPAKPFAEGGVDQLRPVLVYSTLQYLSAEYREFIDREYKVAPSDADEKKMREQAAGK